MYSSNNGCLYLTLLYFCVSTRLYCFEISLHSHGQQGDADDNQVQYVEGITAERPLV